MKVIVEYEYNSGNNDIIGSLLFSNAIAYKFTNEIFADDFIEGSYDKVIALDDSDWLTLLKKRILRNNIASKDSKYLHFCLLLSSNGYLEVIAKQVTSLPSRIGRLDDSL